MLANFVSGFDARSVRHDYGCDAEDTARYVAGMDALSQGGERLPPRAAIGSSTMELACRDFHNAAAGFLTASAMLVRGPPRDRGIGLWGLYGLSPEPGL